MPNRAPRRQKHDAWIMTHYAHATTLILQKVETAHKTLTSPSVTLHKLSNVAILIYTLFIY